MSLNEIQRAAREQFGRQSQQYGARHILADVSDVKEALDSIHLPPCAAVLDLACGAGHTGLHLASLGHEVTLADLSPAMLARTREAAAARRFEIKTREHSAEQLPYSAASFDLVTCRVAPHHFSSPVDFVRESARVLRPEGWFLMIDGSVPDDEPEAEEWIHRIEKLRDPSHHRFLTPSVWSELCKRGGLRITTIKLAPMKQPDLNWYFDTASTEAKNRAEVLNLIESAPKSARRVFRISEEDGRIVWWWPRLTLIAQKP